MERLWAPWRLQYVTAAASAGYTGKIIAPLDLDVIGF